MVDGVSVAPVRTQVCQLLALLSASDRISTEDAIEQLWPGELPADPRRSFRVVLSRARTALGTQREALSNASGVLSLEADCDVRRFRSLVAARSADPDQRLTELEEALELRGRGAPDTVDAVPALESMARMIEQDFRNAAVEATPLLIAAGRPAKAVEWLDQLWAASPDDEPLALALARALVNAVDRSRALAVLNQTQMALRDRHGMGLGSEAEQFLYGLLRGGGDFGATAPSTAPPDAELPLVGVGHLLADLPLDGSEIGVLEGHPGDGKSSLAKVITTKWAAERAHVIHVEASAVSARPMQVIADIITDLLDGNLIEVDDVDAQTAAALKRLLPERFTDAAPFAITRASLVALVARLIANSLRTHDAALLVDDLQHTDWASCEVLQYVVATSQQPIVFTTRIDRSAHVTSLVKHERCRTVRLGALKRDDVADLVARVLPSRNVDVDDLYARSGGHPLFLSLLIRLLIDGDGTEFLPSSVLVAVRHRTSTVSDGARAALSLLSLFSSGVSSDLLSEMRPAIAAEAAELRSADLLAPGPLLRIRHAVIRDAVRQVVPEGALVAWHDQIGWLLEGRGRPVTEWVDHALGAAAFDPGRAAAAAVDAGDEYMSAFAWEQVLELAEAAKAVMSTHSVVDGRLRATASLLEGCARRVLDPRNSDPPLLDAVHVADEFGEAEIAAKALIKLATHCRISVDDPTGDELHAIIERLLDKGDLHDAVAYELACAAGTMLSTSAKQDRATELFLWGYHGAAELGDVEVEVRTLSHLELATAHPRYLDIRKAGAARMRELAGSDVDVLWEAAQLHFGLGLLEADRALVDEAISDLRDLTPRVRANDRSFGLTYLEAGYACMLGDYERAESFTREAERIGYLTFPESWVRQVSLALWAAIADHTGKLGQLLAPADLMLARNPRSPIWHGVAAVAAAAEGDSKRVTAELAFFREIDYAFYVDGAWLPALGNLAEAVRLVDDKAAAAEIANRIEPYSGLMAWNGVTVHRPVAHYLSILHEVLGSAHAAAEYRRQADDTLARLGGRSSSTLRND